MEEVDVVKQQFRLKDFVQRQGLNKWYLNGCVGTLMYCTGSGKTRCGVLATEFVYAAASFPRILVLSPTTQIRDNVWEKEFQRWNLSHLWYSIESECIQTAYKWRNQEFDLVIVDEAHHLLAPEFIKFFERNRCKRVLGLTAFVPIRQRDLLATFAPIVDSLSIKEAIALGLLSPFKVLNLVLEMSPEDKREYNALSEKISWLEEHRGREAAWRMIGKRSRMLYDYKLKYEVLPEIVSHFGELSKGIIFTETIEGAERAHNVLKETSVLYHSKMGKKAKKESLDLFSNPFSDKPHMVVPLALNEGWDLPAIEYAILLASTSSPLEQIQRLGRIVRWEEDKYAYFIRLLMSDTQEYAWTKRSQKYIQNIEYLAYKTFKDGLAGL